MFTIIISDPDGSGCVVCSGPAEGRQRNRDSGKVCAATRGRSARW